MPLSLDATVGGSSSNAYATVAEAEAYASYRVGGAAFIALADDQQIQALVTAAGDIDTLEGDPGFLDDRDDEDQALAFPRGGSGELPANLVKAAIELAMSYAPAFAAGSTTDVLATSTGNGNIKRKKTDVLETEFFEPGTTVATAFARFPAVVQRLLFALVIQPAENGWGSAIVTRGS